MTTALELVKSFGRRKPNQEEVAELHRLREQEVEALSKKDVITVEDIQALEWGVKFEVANKFFDKCEPSAQHALLHDQHHGVRAAAQLFKPAEKPVPPAPAPAPESVAHMTVAEAARTIMNGKQRMATLHGVKTVAGIEDLIASTHPRDVLQRAESFIVGFEGDDMQEGVDQLLADLRAALKPIR
jgi:hypothetical protein